MTPEDIQTLAEHAEDLQTRLDAAEAALAASTDANRLLDGKLAFCRGELQSRGYDVPVELHPQARGVALEDREHGRRYSINGEPVLTAEEAYERIFESNAQARANWEMQFGGRS